MAIRSGFFNSVNGDRKYDASRFAEYFASFIGNGVFPNPSDGLQVMANDDMTVTVKAGKAWINGYILINDDDYILEIEPADGVLNRIDRVVARYDTVDREIRLEVKKGTFSSAPVPPALQRDADAYELGLADIYVRAGAVSITQSDITDLRNDKALCGRVDSLIAGDVTSLAARLDEHLAENASTSQRGHVQLSTSTTSTSTSLAATASAVKTVNDALTSHKAEVATETKLGHVKAKTKEDGTLIIPINIPDGNMYNAVLTTDIDITKKLRESDSYGGNIHAIAADDNYVYVGGASTRTVKKLNKSDLSQVAESASYGGTIYAIAVDNNYVYVGGATTQTVRKLRKSDLSLVAESASYGGEIRAIAVDNNYVYVGGAATAGVVRKLNKSNLSQVATSTNYNGEIRAIAVDNNYVYMGGWASTSPRAVRKLNKSDLSQVATSANYTGIYAIVVDDNYVYVGVGEGTSQTVWKVKKLNKSNMSQVAEGPGSVGYGGYIYAMAVDDDYVYVGGATTQTVWKLNKSDLYRVAESASYDGNIFAMAVTVDNKSVYVGGGTTQTVWKLGGIHIKELIRVV